MLTEDEAQELKDAVSDGTIQGEDRDKLIGYIERVSDRYAPGQGTDVIAKGPDISTTQMLDEAARAFGWRTDWACGDSPITWDAVLKEIERLKNHLRDSMSNVCGDRHEGLTCTLRKHHPGHHQSFRSW